MKQVSLLIVLFSSISCNTYSQSLLWKISGNGLNAPSYLFGTIHIQDKRVFNFNDSLPAKLNEVEQLALELDMSQENLMKMSFGMMLKDGKTLPDVMSKKAYEKLSTLFKKETNQDIAMLHSFSPFAVISQLMSAKLPTDMPLPVDMFLYQKAKELGKLTTGIETIEEQMKLFQDMKDDDIIKFCDDFDNAMGDEFEELIKAYINADLDLVQKLMNDQESYSSDMMEELLDKRNIIMAERIDKKMKEHTMLIGIGTAHLKGKVGVIDLLQKKGYTVEPVVANKSPWPAADNETPDKE